MSWGGREGERVGRKGKGEGVQQCNVSWGGREEGWGERGLGGVKEREYNSAT